jgi:uncharacterized protein (TIGR03435 family)
MFLLVNQLSRALGRDVIDKTGLTAKYDFALAWQPDSATFAIDSPASSDSPALSIFTAIQESLGLRLQPARAPVGIVVIDQVEKPSEN